MLIRDLLCCFYRAGSKSYREKITVFCCPIKKIGRKSLNPVYILRQRDIDIFQLLPFFCPELFNHMPFICNVIPILVGALACFFLLVLAVLYHCDDGTDDCCQRRDHRKDDHPPSPDKCHRTRCDQHTERRKHPDQPVFFLFFRYRRWTQDLDIRVIDYSSDPGVAGKLRIVLSQKAIFKRQSMDYEIVSLLCKDRSLTEIKGIICKPQKICISEKLPGLHRNSVSADTVTGILPYKAPPFLLERQDKST